MVLQCFQSKGWKIFKEFWLITSAFFITIATILGTGVLALPIKVSESGFTPFIGTFIFTLIAQCFDIIFMIDLLQISDKLQNNEKKKKVKEDEKKEKEVDIIISNREIMEKNNGNININHHEEIEEEEEVVENEKLIINNNGDNLNEEIDENEKMKFISEGPDMHYMGVKFLSDKIRWLYILGIIIQFVSILISYSLAGPQCIAKFINIAGYEHKHLYYFFILPFVFVLAMVIIFAARFIEIIISTLTLIKGFLLVLMILLTGILSSKVTNENPTKSNWQYTGRPMLIGTVALGGATNTLPIIYAKLRNTKLSLRLFKIAAISGVLFCFIMNVLWAFFILKIVPNDKLKEALIEEEISTVPLIDIIESKFRQFEWMSYLVDIFVFCSVCVSFVCIGSGMKSVIDGVAKTSNENNKIFQYIKSKIKKPKVFVQFSLYLLYFGTIYLIAQINPQTFFIVMEIFVSFSLNLESGLFICIMIWTAKKLPIDSDIISPMSKFSYYMIIPVFIFFLFAVLYDFFYHGIELIFLIVNWFRVDKLIVPF